MAVHDDWPEREIGVATPPRVFHYHLFTIINFFFTDSKY